MIRLNIAIGDSICSTLVIRRASLIEDSGDCVLFYKKTFFFLFTIMLLFQFICVCWSISSSIVLYSQSSLSAVTSFLAISFSTQFIHCFSVFSYSYFLGRPHSNYKLLSRSFLNFFYYFHLSFYVDYLCIFCRSCTYVGNNIMSISSLSCVLKLVLLSPLF